MNIYNKISETIKKYSDGNEIVDPGLEEALTVLFKECVGEDIIIFNDENIKTPLQAINLIKNNIRQRIEQETNEK